MTEAGWENQAHAERELRLQAEARLRTLEEAVREHQRQERAITEQAGRLMAARLRLADDALYRALSLVAAAGDGGHTDPQS